MSLANLKKHAPSRRPQAITVDEFINQAERYAQGQSTVYTLPLNRPKPASCQEKHLKRATFTLGEVAISQLTQLSQQSGIAKSRLIRIWLAQQQEADFLSTYLSSGTI